MVEFILNHTASDGAHEAFHRFDRGGTGLITLQALKSEFKAADLSLTEEQAQELFSRYDINGDGRITIGDFGKYLNNPRNWEAQNAQKYEPSTYAEGHSPRARARTAATGGSGGGGGGGKPSAFSRDLDRMVHLVQEKIRSRHSSNPHEAFDLLVQQRQGRGHLTQQDFRDVLEAGLGLTLSSEERCEMFDYFDADHDGVLGRSDFTTMVLPEGEGQAESRGVTAAYNVNQRRSWTATGGSTESRENVSSWDTRPSREMPVEVSGDPAARAYHIPGYTGFIRGQQNVAGRTYGNTCRRALNKEYDHNLKRGAIPKSPHKRTVANLSPRGTCVSQDESELRRIPGYQGFCAGSRDRFGHTFGATTKEVLKQPEYTSTMVKKKGTTRLSHFG